MNEEWIVKLAQAQSEYDYLVGGTDWKLRVRLPDGLRIRTAMRAAGGDLDAAAEQLAIEAVVGWTGVTLETAGLGHLAGVKPSDEAPCVPAIVRSVLGERLSLFDDFVSDFMRRTAERRQTFQADEKNSASG